MQAHFFNFGPRYGKTVGTQKNESEQNETINEFHESYRIRRLPNIHSTVWVTYIEGDGGDYIFGVLSLYGSIKEQKYNFTDAFILMVYCGELSESSLLFLSNTGIKVRNHCPDPERTGNSSFGGLNTNWKTFNKLGIFGMKKEFHRLIFVDADIHTFLMIL